MGDDLDYIETLDDLSNAIKLACQQLDGPDASNASLSSLDRRSSSSRPTLGEFAARGGDEDGGDDETEEGISKRYLRDLLLAWQALVETLFAQKKFLQYAPSLENCIAQLSDLTPSEMKRLRDLVHLMTHTVENHKQHECTELRYVTLLEVVLSYNADWRPSSSINELWEELDLQVESDCEAADFRRVAYKVLVQLPWLPASSGLFLACGYEESETISDADALPDHLRAQFDQIYSTPVPRADKVHQILETLQEDEAFTILITFVPEDGSFIETNGEGMGKSTLAALLACHPTIAQNFEVLWVNLDRDWEQEDKSKILPHSKYIKCLEEMCQQLNVSPNWPARIPRLEDAPLRAIRDVEHMSRAKEGMTKILEAMEQNEQNILIVIDGVNDDQDFAWFQFLESQSSIVISKSNFIPGTTYTVEMEGLGQSEAIELFANESSNDPDHRIFRTQEACTVMELCAYHPLIIRTAAHWFKMKQVTAGLFKALEELTLELSVLRNNKNAKADNFKILSEVMNLMLSPTSRQGGPPSKVFKLCLASASAVFGMDKVPLDSILALWSQLLTTHPDTSPEMGENPTRLELSKRVWFVAEAFIHLGLFSFAEEDGIIVVRIHHHLYAKYGISIIPELQPPESKVHETMARWHSAFVTGYNARLRVIKESEGGLKDLSRPYVLHHIIKHMINSKAIPKVLEMLKDDRFCRERLAKFGWVAGARMHIDDCQLLADRAQESKSATRAETQKVVLTCLKRMSVILSEEPDLTDETRDEKAMALHLIGFMQAENNGVNEALTSYKNAMQLMSNASHPFNGIIMYSQAVLHLARNDYDKAIKKLRACVKVLKDHAADENNQLEGLQAEITQLRGDALAAACDYVSAETSYEEVLEQTEQASKVDTGTALYRRARLHLTMGELEQAISALTECVNWKLDLSERTSKNLSQAYSLAGDIYFEFHDDEKAIRQYNSALETLVDLEVGDDDVDYQLLQGKIRLLSGKVDESKGFLDNFKKKTKDAPRLLMDQSAYDMRMVGKIFIVQQDNEMAKAFFEEGVDFTQDRPESLERAFILSELGDCLFHLQQPKDAIVCLEEALKIRKTKLGDCEMVLDSTINLGNMYKKLAMNKECLNASKEVMHLTEKLYRGDESKAASALFGVAEAYEVLGDYNEAVSMFEECKTLLKRAAGSDHPDLANIMQRLARLHESSNNFDKAFLCYIEALEVGKANYEVDHPQLGQMLYNVGVINRKRRSLDKAREHLQEALTIFKSNEMPRETCLSLMELGNVYRLSKEPDTAAMCYERCFTFVHDTKDDPALLGNLYLAFGHARLSKKQIGEAQECFEKALRSRTEQLGKDHLSTAKASRSLGIAKYLSKSSAEARIYLEDFVRVMDARQDAKDVNYVLALQLLGEINFVESRTADAKRYWTKARRTLDDFPAISQSNPELGEMIKHRMDKAETQTQETKSFFSRFTELARFEDEVSAELPVEERLEQVITTIVFMDD